MIDPGKRPRILVVNDDPEALELIAGALRKDETIDICIAKDRGEGWRPSETRPDLIICPSRDYKEWKALRHQIRKDDGPPSPLILLVSDGAEVREMAASLEHWARPLHREVALLPSPSPQGPLSGQHREAPTEAVGGRAEAERGERAPGEKLQGIDRPLAQDP